MTDVDGQAWSLRDGRHLGERRIQAAKEDMSCDAGPSVDGAASASDSRRRCVGGAAQATARAPNREVHSTITQFDRGDRPFGLVVLGAGRLREGSMDDFIPSGELAYLAVDLRRGSGMDVQQRAVADAIGHSPPPSTPPLAQRPVV